MVIEKGMLIPVQGKKYEMERELLQLLEHAETYCGICQLLERGYTTDTIAADLAIRHRDILEKANKFRYGAEENNESNEINEIKRNDESR
jgi:hypothetical protein